MKITMKKGYLPIPMKYCLFRHSAFERVYVLQINKLRMFFNLGV